MALSARRLARLARQAARSTNKTASSQARCFSAEPKKEEPVEKTSWGGLADFVDGLDKNMRETYKDHPMYEQTLEFIEKYDAPAFAPEAETYPLSFFEPMIQRVFEKPKQSLYKSETSTAFQD